MKVNTLTRKALSSRRFAKEKRAAGWEEIGEGGGGLWELNRGWRWNQVITDCAIHPSGKSLWVKI